MVQFDVTSLVLGLVILGLLVAAFYLRPPPPHAHPFLLGRQSIAARTRLANETPVYTNSVGGGVRPSVRPGKVQSLADIVTGSLTQLEGGNPGTWVRGGEKLAVVVNELRAGFLSTLGPGPGTVAVLVEDPTDALLVTLALALTTHKPLVISPGSNLPSTTPVTAIIQSSTLFTAAKGLSATPDAKWISLGGAGEKATVAEDLLVTGRALVANGEAPSIPAVEPSDIALTIVSEGVPLSFSHQNLTASLVSWLSVFPASPRVSRPDIKDHIVSLHHPSTPYGFGLALLALHTNAALSFPTLPALITPESIQPVLDLSPPTTIVFAPSATFVQPLYALLLSKMTQDRPFIIRRARDGKMSLLREGTISQTTLWDSLLFGTVRSKARLHHLRALVLQGPALQARIEFFRIALGVPVFPVLSHAFLLAPLSATMMHDLQRLPPVGKSVDALDGKELSHVGPPVIGIELKLRGNEVDIAAGRARGEVLLRSPTLPQPSSLPTSLLLTDLVLPQLPPYPASGRSASSDDGSAGGKWLRTGLRAEIGPEGVLWLET